MTLRSPSEESPLLWLFDKPFHLLYTSRLALWLTLFAKGIISAVNPTILQQSLVHSKKYWNSCNVIFLSRLYSIFHTRCLTSVKKVQWDNEEMKKLLEIHHKYETIVVIETKTFLVSWVTNKFGIFEKWRMFKIDTKSRKQQESCQTIEPLEKRTWEMFYREI